VAAAGTTDDDPVDGAAADSAAGTRAAERAFRARDFTDEFPGTAPAGAAGEAMPSEPGRPSGASGASENNTLGTGSTPDGPDGAADARAGAEPERALRAPDFTGPDARPGSAVPDDAYPGDFGSGAADRFEPDDVDATGTPPPHSSRPRPHQQAAKMYLRIGGVAQADITRGVHKECHAEDGGKVARPEREARQATGGATAARQGTRTPRHVLIPAVRSTRCKGSAS
jgi:hypothetical protein